MPYYWDTGIIWAQGGGGETNPAPPWTYDLNIPPSSVYALANLNYYTQDGSLSGAVVGFQSYVTQDPDTGIPTENPTSGQGGDIWNGGWLAPSILDDNVIIITIACSCFADDYMEAMGAFTVFLGLD
jgi:hypothetical protein